MQPLHIPKQSDVEIVAAFGRVAKEIPDRDFNVRVHVEHQPGSGYLDIDARGTPEKHPALEHILKHGGRISHVIDLVDRSAARIAVRVRRDNNQPYDGVEVGPDNYFGHINDERKRAELFIVLSASCRSQLKASDYESTFDGLGDKPWTRYLESQRIVLDALQTTTQRLLVDAARRNDEFEAARQKKYAEMEEEFRSKAEKERTLIATERQQVEDALKTQRAELQSRIDAFNTKEGRYVARQKQDEQIKQVAAWIEKWDLTKSTNEKRRPIALAYLLAIVFTAAFTIWVSWLSAEALKGNVATLSWWQWLWLSLKTVLPFAACTTFIAYFIQWSASWAKQHADEEIRNRSRLIDIGRSGWLLEAVRDAQQHNKELPPELLKELSRNLFAVAVTTDRESHPQPATDMLLQGLSSLRVKTVDGSEIEAKREKAK